ncbi:tautomerase family protein [Thalassospira sp. MA62]|nr:tautomerase family protein [Thalassospira sp. MA62]
MPHVVVKARIGKTEDQKKRLADAITENLIDILACEKDEVSVAVQEVDPKDWKETVYDPEIRGHDEILYKKPGYEL